MPDWDAHRDELFEKYMTENRTVTFIRDYMLRTHNFVASKDQYENQFRKRWKWEKNMTSDEWKYVAKRLKERGDRPTTVLFRQNPIPPEKVKKKIRIYDLPTFIPYKPKGSDRVIVRTPPHTSPRLLSPVDSQMILTRKRPLQQSSTHDLISTVSGPIPKRIRLESIALPPRNAVTWEPQHGMAILENNPKTIFLPDLDDLPFFKFQDFMRSPEFRCGFEQLIAPNNNYSECSWSRLTTAHSDDPLTALDDIASDAESESEEVGCLIPYLPPSNGTGQTHTSFATSLFNINNRNRSINASPRTQLHSILASFPKQSMSEFSDTMEQLLGPPTIEAALRYVELGIYMCSNNLDEMGNVDSLSRWMIQTIPWSSLKPIFRTKLRSLQAFSERFLATAVGLAKVTIVRDLLEPSIHQNLIDHVQASGRVLCKAVQSDNIELIALILSVGANPNAKSDDYWYGTPLCFARSVPVAHVLIEAGADPDCIGRDAGMSESPLIQAVCAGNVPVARCLISVQANVNTCIEIHGWKNGSPRFVSALSVAVDCGDLDMVELLLGAGAEVNVFCCSYDCALRFAPDDSHLVHPYDYEWFYDIICTPLQAAAMLGRGHIARLLLDHGSDVNARSAGSLTITALEAATSACNVDLVRLLLQRGADVNIPEPREGNTSTSVLHMAVDLNHLELVNIFLDANANVNALSLGKYGCSIMESAKLCPESGAIVQALIAKGVSEIQVPLLRCRLELRDAVWDGNFEKVEALYASGVQINMELIPGDLHEDPKPGQHVYSQTGTILHYAIYDWHNTPSNIELFQFLVERVGDINIHNQNLKLTPILHLAIEIGDMDLIRILLDAGVDTNTVSPESTRSNYKGVSPLCLAACTYDLSLISLLIDHGADINLLIGDRLWVTASQFLLSYGDDEEDISIVSERRLAVVKLMLERGALLDTHVSSEVFSQTELVMAVRTDDLKLVELLLGHGADVNFFPQGIGRLTPLQAAAQLTPPNLDIVHLLISKGADINAPAAIKDGMTALQFAASSGNFEIARYLLEAGADVNAVGSWVYYRTALEAAISEGRLDIVYLLLQAGTGLYVFGNGYREGQTELGSREVQDVRAVDWARQCGRIAIAEMIEEWYSEHGVWNAFSDFCLLCGL